MVTKRNSSFLYKAMMISMFLLPLVKVIAEEPTGDEGTDTTYYTYEQFRQAFKSWRGSGSFNKVVSLGWQGVALYLSVDVFAAALAYVIAIMRLGSVDDPKKQAEAKQAILSQIITIALLGATPAVILIFSVIFG